ncbi:MAG TPA: hypothetical protein VKB84_16240 [Candidatus Binataceae bacterium]|nr:hypothetical protein [Candidatus Binataceae bacterium]
MDLASAEESKTVRFASGLALAGICLALWSNFALNQTFIEVKRSVVGGLTVVEKIDSILENLDSLTKNQRAFLSTGEAHFAEEVAESIMAINHDLETLEQISISRVPLQPYVSTLSYRVKMALDSIRKTYDLQQNFGSGVAMAQLDNDDAVDAAKIEALALKSAATDGMFDRVQTECCKIRSILEVLF